MTGKSNITCIPKQPYSPQDRQFIIDNMETMTNQQLADALGRTSGSIANYMSDNALKRTRTSKSTRNRGHYFKTAWKTKELRLQMIISQSNGHRKHRGGVDTPLYNHGKCVILLKHAEDLKDDPERLRTDFMINLIEGDE